MSDSSFLLLPFFETRHRQLAQDLDDWCSDTLSNHQFTGDLNRDCRALAELLADGGWLRYVVPEEYGGALPKIDVRSLCLLRETLARFNGLADFVFAMQGLGSGTITLFGTPAQKLEYLPRVARGEWIAAFALTEAASGSDVASLETNAQRIKGGYLVNGSKTFISNAGLADYYVVFARTGEAPGSRGISAFLVDSPCDGFDDRERITVNAPHPLGTLKFKDCFVAENHLLGESGAGFKQAMATLDVFRSTVGAAALGFARHALYEATQRCLTRKLFGQTLASNPLTQSSLAEMALQVDASALLIYRAAWLYDMGVGRTTREAAMAKLYATESAQIVIDKAVQLFGGMGVVVGVPVEALYREIRSLRIYEGASEVQKIVIARQHLAAFETGKPGT